MRTTAETAPRPQLQPSRQPQQAPAPAAQSAPPSEARSLAPLARPAALKLPLAKASANPVASYAEMAERNAALIEAAAAALKASLAARGVGPSEVGLVLNLDITGHEVQVCLACGRIGHDYMPTMVRQQNPEINMLSEELVVFQEVAARVGIAYGIVAYDEQVLPLRRVAPPEVGMSGRAEVTARFNAFLGRHDNKHITDGVVMDWMKKEMERWNPADATKKLVGDPADRRAMETAQGIFGDDERALRGIVMVKAQPASASLRALEATAKSRGFKLRGIAVGQRAEDTAKTMLAGTTLATDIHDLREHTTRGMKALADLAG